MGEVENLIARVQEGDSAAFEELVERYQHKVYALAFTLAGNREDAEDLTQEIFLRIYAALPDFVNDGRSFDAWVHKIGLNLWIDWWRQRKKIKIFSLEAAREGEENGTAWEIASTEEEVDERVKKREFWEALWRAYGELSENCRVTLKLRAIDQLSYREIASLLNKSEAAIKSGLNRCRQLLKQKMARAGFFIGSVL